jgi:predicted  nucleic acid-binding Zn-ribbon protein
MKHLGQLIREIISVIIGILVALLINNWNEDRKDTKYLNKIFSSIEKELEESAADIERVIPMQKKSVDSIQKYLDNDKFSIYDIIIRSNGVNAPIIKTNAWNAIANSKIELIAYDKLSALADIEDSKENLRWRLEKQMDFLFQNMEQTDKTKKVMLKMIISDMIYAEQELLAHIEEILKNELAVIPD